MDDYRKKGSDVEMTGALVGPEFQAGGFVVAALDVTRYLPRLSPRGDAATEPDPVAPHGPSRPGRAPPLHEQAREEERHRDGDEDEGRVHLGTIHIVRMERTPIF